MGGKGQKRREKNYKAAHGGNSRLPPPPDPSSVDAFPSKLRTLMNFAKQGLETKKEASGGIKQKNRIADVVSDGGGLDKKHHLERKPKSDVSLIKTDKSDDKLVLQHSHDGEKEMKKKKRKRKAKQIDDLRFGTAEELGLVAGSKRKQLKKKRLEERKKKHKKAKVEEIVDFPGHEQIKFGDVVEAPPKLLVVPKASKTPHNASQERLRLQAVEAYRKRRGWASRPGIHLPTPTITPSSL